MRALAVEIPTARIGAAMLLLFSLLLLLLPSLGLASDTASVGPQPFRFGPVHHQPTTLQSYGWSIYVETSVENVWMYDPELYRIDGEINQVLLQTRYRPTPKVELALGVPFRFLSGGLLDRVIEDFHSVFGLGDDNRPVAEDRDVSVVIVDPRTGEQQLWVDQQKRGWSLAEPVFEATLQMPLEAVDLAVHGFVRLPLSTGPENLSGYLPRTGLSLALGRRFGSFYGSASGGFGYVDHDRYMGVALRPWVRSFALGLEYHPGGSAHSLFFQGLATDGAAEEFASLSQGRYQVKFGYGYRFNPGARLEIGILENVFRFNNTPDFGLHMGITQGI